MPEQQPQVETTLVCPVDGCPYRSQSLPFDQAVVVLQIHTGIAHNTTVTPATAAESSKLEKVPRPQIKLGISQDAFQFFKSRWRQYVRSCKITDADVLRDQLTACCSHDLMVDLHRSLGTRMEEVDEQTLLSEIENLAVEKHSNLVNINKLMSTNQEREESIRNFYSRVKGIAATCELTVTCPKTCTCGLPCQEQVSYAQPLMQHAIIKGLADDTTQQEICSKTEKLTIEDAIAFIEAREGGKKTKESIAPSVKTTEVSKVTAYRKNKNSKFSSDDQRCKFCNRSGHGVNSSPNERSVKCPAYNTKCDFCSKPNHFQVVCRQKKQQENSDQQQTNVNTVRVSIFRVNMTKVPHLTDTGSGLAKQLPPDPSTIRLKASVSFSTYKNNNFPCYMLRSHVTEENLPIDNQSDLLLNTDTGAQVNVLPLQDILDLGMDRTSVLPTSLCLDGADHSNLPVIGVIFLDVEGETPQGETMRATDSFYIIEKGAALASKALLQRLGCLPKEWPTIGQFSRSEVLSTSTSRSTSTPAEGPSLSSPTAATTTPELPTKCQVEDIRLRGNRRLSGPADPVHSYPGRITQMHENKDDLDNDEYLLDRIWGF